MENSKRINANYFREILLKYGLLYLLCRPIRLEPVLIVFALSVNTMKSQCV